MPSWDSVELKEYQIQIPIVGGLTNRLFTYSYQGFFYFLVYVFVYLFYTYRQDQKNILL